MDSKTKITQAILETLNPAYTSNDLKEALSLWWINQRKKTKGGLKLTKIGFDRLSQGGLKFYQIQIEKIELITNQFLIWLDRFIDCPFIIVRNKIFVSSEKMAVQLVLFSGDLLKFTSAKARSLKSA